MKEVKFITLGAEKFGSVLSATIYNTQYKGIFVHLTEDIKKGGDGSDKDNILYHAGLYFGGEKGWEMLTNTTDDVAVAELEKRIDSLSAADITVDNSKFGDLELTEPVSIQVMLEAIMSAHNASISGISDLIGDIPAESGETTITGLIAKSKTEAIDASKVTVSDEGADAKVKVEASEDGLTYTVKGDDIASAKDLSTLAGRVDVAESSINTLTGDEKTVNSVKYQIEKAKKDILLGDATGEIAEAYDTIKEIADWIKNAGGSEATNLAASISEHEALLTSHGQSIGDLTTLVGESDDTKEDNTLFGKIADAKADAKAAQDDVDALVDLVGELPEGTDATTVVEYVDAKVGTATSAAEAAQSAAEAAQTSANNAQSAAEAAQTSANNAQSAADDAQEAVDNLADLVGELPKGTDATTIVDYVDAKVGVATAAAATAQSAADGAKSAADNAQNDVDALKTLVGFTPAEGDNKPKTVIEYVDSVKSETTISGDTASAYTNTGVDVVVKVNESTTGNDHSYTVSASAQMVWLEDLPGTTSVENA